VLTASYEARPFGVRSAMPLFKARALCPDLIVVQPDFERYREASRTVFEIFGRGATAVEGLSLDEAYVGLVTEDVRVAAEYARSVRAAVRAEAGLTVSAGIAAQKMVAKIASDAAKPDGLAVVAPGNEAVYLAPMPVARLWGVGPKTQARLLARGVETIGQVAALSDALAFDVFGRAGKAMRDLARGIDTRPVEADRETRSVSAEQTFEYDLADGPALRMALHELSLDVARRLQAHGLRGSTIGVKIRRSDFTTLGRQTTVALPTRDPDLIEAAALLCLERAALGEAPVRLLGVRVSFISEAPERQTSLFAPES
jgi:DNA polymerase-4